MLFDEDSGTFWNQVVAVAVGPWVNGPQMRDGTLFNHYSMLKTWEAAWELPPIGPGDRAAAPMLGAFNLLPAGAGRSGRLARAHPEIDAAIDVRYRSGAGPASLLSLDDVVGAEFRVSLAGDGRLRFTNPLTGDATSDQALSPGWHRLVLHVLVRGSAGTCEVGDNGRPVQGLTWVGTCPTGFALLLGYQFGRQGGQTTGPTEFRRAALATSPP